MGRTGLVFAAIAPHGGIAIAEACSPDEREVIVAARLKGRLNGVTPPVELEVPSERELAWRVLESFASAGLSSAAVSFGSNDPSTAVAPMDWGVLIPLWFLGGRGEAPAPVVVVTPARELSAADHVTAGAAI